MLIVLILIGIVLIVTGVLVDKNTCHEGIGFIIPGAVLVVISVIAFFVMLGAYTITAQVDRKIEIYEQENERIETQINATIESYKEYEKETYSEFKPDETDIEIMIMCYPELTASELVQEQLKIYTENRQQIKTLKVEKINQRVYAWWLWFGEGKS